MESRSTNNPEFGLSRSLFKAINARTLSLSILTAAALAGSTSLARETDEYLRTELPSRWYTYSDSGQSSQKSEARWWKRFDDPVLDSLIEIGLLRNYDIAMATRRIEIARNAEAAAKSGFYPTVGVSAGYDLNRTSGRMAGTTGSAVNSSYFQGTINMSWEIDVFGRVNAGVNAKKKAVQISRAERAGIKVSLEAEIASAYIQIRVSQAQLKVAREHSEKQLKVLKIAEARHETGLASMLDVDQAQSVYYNTIASIPMLENTIHNQIVAISVLLGEEPGKVFPALEEPRDLPSYIQLVESGIPADLLRRRPDIVKAEEQIGQAAAQVGIAKKDYLPTLSLTGSLGAAAHNAGDLFSRSAFTYSVAPTLSWTIFDGFQRRYSVASAKESFEEAIQNYNLTVLTAYQETDNALSTYFSNLKYISNLDNLVSASRDYDRLSIEQYKSGLAAFINVANAQLSYLTYQNTLIEAQGQALTALINLYKALGGGWSDTDLRQD